MAHNIETMAFSGATPWHGLGVEVPADLTPIQMLDAASLNWNVRKIRASCKVAGKHTHIGYSALVRDSDQSILDVVSDDWNPVQNIEAFEFFNDFIAAGDMEMHTAGSLQNGQIVWALAKVKESFDLFGGDQIDSYMLFTNFHKYGFSTDVRFTPIRVVCNNTLTLSLSSKIDRMVKYSHRKAWNPDDAKLLLGIGHEKLAKYKEMSEFLGSKKYTNESIVEYFTRVFPVTGSNKREKTMSRNATEAMETLLSQPGASFAEGTYWQAFNAVTFMTDHTLGRNDNNRLVSAWYGANKNLKTNALELAIEFANAA